MGSVVDTSVLLDIRLNDSDFGVASATCLARHLGDGLWSPRRPLPGIEIQGGSLFPGRFSRVRLPPPFDRLLAYTVSPHGGFTMHDPEQQLQEQETRFPLLSNQAFTAARHQALASGHSLVESSGGVLYHVSPDGARRMLRQLEPPTLVVPGTKFRLP